MNRSVSLLLLLLLCVYPLRAGEISPTINEVLIKLDAKPALELKIVDKKLRIIAYIPDLQDKNASFSQARLSTWVDSQGREMPNHFTVDFATAISSMLEQDFKIMFPNSVVIHSLPPDDQEFEFLLKIDMRSQGSQRAGFSVTAMIDVEDKEGKHLDHLEAEGWESQDKEPHWTVVDKSRSMANSALRKAVKELCDNLLAVPSLHSLVQRRAEDRARPAGLETLAVFNDNRSVLPNGRLDAGEVARLVFTVRNNGPGTAFGVRVRANSDGKGVSLMEEGQVGDLPMGASKEVSIPILADLTLTDKGITLRVETLEKRGFDGRPLAFEVRTEALKPPRLEIVDIALNDKSGRALGDGDGQPANGETIEAIVRVRNAGPGEAGGVAVTMASPKVAAEILDPKVVLPRIAADRVEEARLLFRLPLTVQATDLPLSFKAVEARGPQVGSATRDQAWKIRTKRPGVELAYRLYDGNSAGSSGNRDGQVNNGERIEVLVAPANRGDLPARGVRIAVESDDPKLIPRPAVLDVGDLPAQAEGMAQRFAFDVPRGYGVDRSAGDLHFTLTVSQQDFPPRREPIALDFRTLRPELTLETALPPTLTRGTRGELALRLRNTGPLRAEEIVMEVVSANSGVDLLDERGVPVQSRKITLGGLDPQASAPGVNIPINVRRNASLGSTPLRITLTQKDFPQIVRNDSVAVTEEVAAVIEAPPTLERAPERLPAFAPAAQATISFLRNTPGEHLIAEAAVLRFEIQSPAELAEVRLTQNERLLPLEGARRSASVAAGMQLTQIELPVQLEDGENRFEVVVVTRQGLPSVRSLSLFHDREVGRLWVVAIGVSKYQDPAIPSLGYADADARAVYEYFRGTFNLPDSQVFLRINEQATLREVKSLLGTQLVARANDSKDTVILYFAGHGMRDRVTGSLDPDGLSKYFLPYDANRNDLYSTALEMDEVTNILRRLTPERVVVLFDSCFSGAVGGRSPFDPKAAGERAPISSEFLDRMAHVGKGRVVLTASGPNESAQESADFSHGVFTYYLLEGLSGAADLNGDGDIDVHESYAYISEKVSRATHGKQNPKLKEPDLVGQILLGHGAVRRRRP